MINCVQRTNIQNLKAIHNCEETVHLGTSIVFKERIYKIWKQFTTKGNINFCNCKLCSKNEYTKSESNSQHPVRKSFLFPDCVQRTNIQNLKAIHNVSEIIRNVMEIVFKERIYKIWKQFTTNDMKIIRLISLCSKNEYTKSESNSQRISGYQERIIRTFVHFYAHNYSRLYPTANITSILR